MAGDFWTAEEDRRLFAALELGMDYEQIARDYLPRRTPRAIISRADAVRNGRRTSYGASEYEPAISLAADLAFREMCQRGSAMLLDAMLTYYQRREAA